MKKIIWIIAVMLVALVVCTIELPEAPEPSGPAQTEDFDYGIYELSFTEEAVSGDGTDQWKFIYSYNGETIDSDYQITYSLEQFTFYYIQVEVIEKGTPSNTYTAKFPVAICEVGFGKTEITVTSTDGKMAIFKISCRVILVDKEACIFDLRETIYNRESAHIYQVSGFQTVEKDQLLLVFFRYL